MPVETQEELVTIARTIAAEFDLRPELICGICEEESGNRDGDGMRPETWNPFAVRFEREFEDTYVKPLRPAMPTTEELTRAMSFGLMQIMGLSAREHGFRGRFLTELLDPTIGVRWGCMHFVHLLEISQSEEARALLLYNGGGDQGYPDRVLARATRYEE